MGNYSYSPRGDEGTSSAWAELLPPNRFFKSFEIVVDADCHVGLNREASDDADLISLSAGEGYKMESAAVGSARILESGVGYRWAGETANWRVEEGF